MPDPILLLPRDTVLGAIARHRALVMIDEGLFSDDGEPLVGNDELAASEAAIDVSWMDLMAVPCRTLGEVHAKIDYVMNGTVGNRQPLVEDLTGPEWSFTFDPANTLPVFLRSLLGMAPLDTDPDEAARRHVEGGAQMEGAA